MQYRKTFLPMLTLMGMTALAPVLAQEQEQPGVSPEAEQQQEMTQPGARSASEASGLTLTGEVIAMDEQALRVRTATGVENVILTDRTDKPADLKIGDRVAVDFTRSSQGVMIASEVRRFTDTDTDPERTGASQPMSGSQVMSHAGQGTAGSTAGSLGATGTTGSTTGSGQPEMTDVSSTGSQTAETGEPMASTGTLEDPGTASATAPLQTQPLAQTGSATGMTTGTTGSTYGSTTGTTTGTTGSTLTQTPGTQTPGTQTPGTPAPETTSTETLSTGTTDTGSSLSGSGLDTETETASQYGTADTLPATGGRLPLAGLAGLLALGLAFALRLQR